ncbi:fungal transcriptional regulatory protein [Purpureocillium lilacinum]|nr:fungal transcriptional regulatory protein [Purpureocillium lilacinum]OAQ89329.1 fungal transcriptional regulatory protein [Purpureocillium lilacinum]
MSEAPGCRFKVLSVTRACAFDSPAHSAAAAVVTVHAASKYPCFTIDEDEEAAVSRTTPSHSHTEAGTLRKRAQRACSQCHSHKTKCSGDLPRCKRCEASNLNCEYTPAKRRFTNVRFQNAPKSSEVHSSAPSKSPDDTASPLPSTGNSAGAFNLLVEQSPLNAEDLLARKNLILRHVDAFMHNLYWLPCQGYFHPKTLYREIEAGTLDPAQAASICALASFFVNPTESGREFGLKCSNHVELYLFHNVHKFSDESLIIFALNITFNCVQGSFAKVWQCFGIATRLMLGLRINWDVVPPGRTFIQQECLRRIGWHFFHVDRLLAGGYEEYISCRADIMKIPLPCDETAFRENRPVVAEKLYDKPSRPPRTINMHAFQIRLIDLRHRIQVTTKRLCSASGANFSHIDASKIMADINGLQNELTRFHASLPTDILLSDQSISRYMAMEERPGYVFLHCHLAGSHIDLYRYFLPGQKEKIPVEILRKLPPEFIARSQKQAVAHSMSFGRFCDAIQNEVDQMRDTGRLELAGDCSTIQIGTSCVRVLLIALQHQLYRDITRETTAPLWRMGDVDEAHIRFLIKAVQRMTEPWRDILTIAQQAYEHNKALVEHYDKTKKVSDGLSPDRTFQLRANGDGRLPGPDFLLESVAAGTLDDLPTNVATDTQGSDRWLRSSQPHNGGSSNSSNSPSGGFVIEPGTPGIPILLAQARSASMDPSEMCGPDTDTSMVGMGSVTDALPNGHPMAPPNGLSMMPMNGGIDPAMYQQAQGVPGAAFMMAPQGVFMDGYGGQYMNGQQGPPSYGHQGYG